MKFGSLINFDLFVSDIAKSLLSPLMYKGERRQYGILESPATNLFTGEVSYKVFVCGKTGCGKTTTISNASGHFGLHNSGETTGIKVTNVYWPVIINETKASVLFKISFWDVGESVLNSYNHILTSCMEDVDCVIYTFSLINKTTWEDLPKLITRIDADDSILKIVLGTKLDLDKTSSKSSVTRKMMKDFEQVWGCPVIKISNNLTAEKADFADCFKKSANFMNRLCELLWYRDQVKVGLIPKSLVDFCFVDPEESDYPVCDRKESSTSLKGSKVTFC